MFQLVKQVFNSEHAMDFNCKPGNEAHLFQTSEMLTNNNFERNFQVEETFS